MPTIFRNCTILGRRCSHKLPLVLVVPPRRVACGHCCQQIYPFGSVVTNLTFDCDDTRCTWTRTGTDVVIHECTPTELDEELHELITTSALSTATA